jgi:hypothetical protein
MSEMFDLVDEMQWEDVTDFLSLEEAGLEEAGSCPMFGGHSPIDNGMDGYLSWFYDGEQEE